MYTSMFDNDDKELPYEVERLADGELLDDELEEAGLRPQTLSEYCGQEQVKENLSIFIKAAAERKESLDHVLLYGPPGLGKTTLAGIIAREMGVGIKVTSGPAIEKAGDLAAVLTNLQPRDVLFIDEIHRLNHSVEEVLYPAMEDFCIDIMIGKGPAARSVRLDLPPFTLVGATTRAGLLTAPLRDRFGVISRLKLYEPEELVMILRRDASLLAIGTTEEALHLIACRSRGTPRVAIRLLKRLRDFAQVRGDGVITEAIAEYGLKALQIDPCGLDGVDLRILHNMADMYDGGPVGLDTLAATTGEDAGTIEDVYEPFLLRIGYIMKTPRGRMLTLNGWKHINKQPSTTYEERMQLRAAKRSQQLSLNELSQETNDSEGVIE